MAAGTQASSRQQDQERLSKRQRFVRLTNEACSSLFDSDGRLVKEAEMRLAMFKGECVKLVTASMNLPTISCLKLLAVIYCCAQVVWMRDGDGTCGNISSRYTL